MPIRNWGIILNEFLVVYKKGSGYNYNPTQALFAYTFAETVSPLFSPIILPFYPKISIFTETF